MATDTWNFPCYTCNDWGDNDAGGRGAHGMVWAIGPEISTVQPFTNTITGIFSIFMRSGWSDVTHSLTQFLTSIGSNGATQPGFYVALTGYTSGSALRIYTYDMTGTALRRDILLGDENGTDWFQADKWYQVAFSISDTAFSYCVNGSTTPKTTVTSAVTGNHSLSYGNDRLWYHCGAAGNAGVNTLGDSQQSLIQSGWPTYIVGSAAWSTTYLDLSSSTVRDRIFDTNGDFKNPGENGSLWFGDTYSATTPEFYFLDGSPRRDNGTYNLANGQDWVTAAGGGTGSVTCPGGLRKQYEL